jgi:prophage maintenance system killer protein
VATVAAIVFLTLNGFDVDADDDDLERLAVSVAEGETPREDIASFLRNCSQ